MTKAFEHITTEDSILGYARRHKSFYPRDIAAAIGGNPNSVRNRCSEMVSAGKLKKNGDRSYSINYAGTSSSSKPEETREKKLYGGRVYIAPKGGPKEFKVQRMATVKELIAKNDLTFDEIARQTGIPCVALAGYICEMLGRAEINCVAGIYYVREVKNAAA